MARTINNLIGRQGEQLYNSEQYKLYQVLKHVVDTPVDIGAGPEAEIEGSLWLEQLNGDMKYYSEGIWKLLFNDRFRMTSEILSPVEPNAPVPGQIWLNDGVLMCWNGVSWTHVKASAVDSDYSMSAFEQFLMLNPLAPSGSKVIDGIPADFDFSTVQNWVANTPYVASTMVIYAGDVYRCTTNHTSGLNFSAINWTKVTVKSQFLLPDTAKDKFFINGAYVDDHDIINKVTIQYPASELLGKTASAVHVNPSKLIEIKKTLVKINKTLPIIAIPEANTEFYAFDGTAGRLLLKTSDLTTEYTSLATGIQLRADVAQAYNYVLAVTYKFEPVKSQGGMFRDKVDLSANNSIFIGSIADPFNVFVQGMYLDENAANYTYDFNSGYLHIALETKLSVSVIAFSKKEKGEILEYNVNGKGVITLAGTFNHPLVFVCGENMNESLVDYTQVGNKLYVNNAVIGMKYSVVEILPDLITPETDMFIGAGIVPTPALNGEVVIPYDPAKFGGDIVPILFIDGFLLAQEDLEIDTSTNTITAFGLTAGQEYVMLKDTGSRIIFDDTASFTTIPTSHMDSAMVYVGSHLICDALAVTTSKLPTTGIAGEIKLLADNGTSQWYEYVKDLGWNLIDETLNPAYVAELNSTAISYVANTKSISILQNFENQSCSYIGYTYANTIEQPLLRDYILTNGVNKTFEVNFKHPHPMNTNSLSVWYGGIRQYHVQQIDPTTFGLCYEYPDPNYPALTIQEALEANQRLFYVVEKPESKETKACERKVLTYLDKIDGTINVYDTGNFDLFPGNIRVFIGGYRQPNTFYRVLDANTIMVKDIIMGSADNFPEEVIDNGTITHKVADEILIEIRQDYNLREVTIQSRYPGQKEFFIGKNTLGTEEDKDGLDLSLIQSKDFVMIYINGACYGKEYSIDKDRGCIRLLNDEVTSKITINDKITLEWR
jgi:hypothetical protein